MLDAKGGAYTLAGTTDDQVEFVAGQPAYIATFVFRPQPGQGDPARLALYGQRLATFRVPFTLKNVPVR